MQIIKVNIIEASSEIAIEIIKQKYKEAGWEEDMIETFLYEADEKESLKLREEYQGAFNNLYDVIYTVLKDIQY